MDNFPHLKVHWPMLGREKAQLSLSFGVNDIDGTIDDSTRIYSMSGSEEQNPFDDNRGVGYTDKASKTQAGGERYIVWCHQRLFC